MRFVLCSQLLLSLWRVSEAIQCFSCIANDRAGKFCRRVSEAQIVTCPTDSTFCNALVFLKNGVVNVDRGCGGSVSSWGFGNSECDIMGNEALMDVGVAFYQCRGDACNNIEPADDTPVPKQDSGVVLLTKTVEQADNSGMGLASNVGGSSRVQAPSSYPDDDEDAGYGPKVKTTKRPPPPPPAPTTQRYIATTEEEVDTEAPYVPVKVTTRPPVRTKPAYPSEDTTEAPAPYQPPAPRPTPPAPVPRTKAPIAYPVETPEPAPYQPPRTPPPPPKPTPKDIGYGGNEEEEEEDTVPPFTTTRARTPPNYGEVKEIDTVQPYAPRPTPPKPRPAYPEVKEVETEEPAYGPPPTTTTTTTVRRTRPQYGGGELINTEETVVTFRPTRRPRTVFDRR